ncbi:TIGR03943 family protein [Nocardioides sp. IC4_145]|uniref:TIGR03943 family putative permease subunit n=1 Tax=Nocardioides sp. IC4_145 TaxID=2714037 RepID=UPI00140DA07A|nr:TIGR03943 family protein [Nocardioides sp. IC4_145]
MRPAVQALLLALLAVVLVRLSVTGEHLRYVADWMRWPLLASAVLLLAAAAGPLVAAVRGGAHDRGDDHVHKHDHEHGHGVPLVTWLLVLPALVAVVVDPPELGSYLAERRAGDTTMVAEPDEVTVLDGSQLAAVPLDEFIWRAQEGGATLEGQPVTLTGFVSYGGDRSWFVTRMAISCCAADAAAYRVQVEGPERPARDQWVEVDGTYVVGSGTAADTAPSIAVTEVRPVAAPEQTYG